MGILLPPIVTKEKVTPDQLPSYLNIQGMEYAWKVTVTPVKDPTHTGTIRTVVTAAYNNRTGSVGVNNIGRDPITAPVGTDDLRPCSFHVWGLGTQIFKVMVPQRTNVYVEVKIEFD